MNRVTLAALAALALSASACADQQAVTSPDLSPSLVAGGNSATAGNKLQCFDGASEGAGNGVCTIISGGAYLVNAAPGDYSGVYIANSNLDGKRLTEINKLAFTYATTTATGGSPRITVPVDLNGDGNWDDFLSADALGCTDGTATAGTVDVIHDPTCAVSLNGQPMVYPNWAAFLAAFPTARVATNAISFVIADQPGTFTITNVQLGKGPAQARP